MPKKKKVLEDCKRYYTYSTKMVQFKCPKCDYEMDQLREMEELAGFLFERHLKNEHSITIEEL